MELYATKPILAARKDFKQVRIDDLWGLRVSVLADSSYKLLLSKGYTVSDLSVTFTVTGNEAVRTVSQGTADVAIEDTNLLIARLKEYPNNIFYLADDRAAMLSYTVAITRF